VLQRAGDELAGRGVQEAPEAVALVGGLVDVDEAVGVEVQRLDGAGLGDGVEAADRGEVAQHQQVGVLAAHRRAVEPGEDQLRHGIAPQVDDDAHVGAIGVLRVGHLERVRRGGPVAAAGQAELDGHRAGAAGVDERRPVGDVVAVEVAGQWGSGALGTGGAGAGDEARDAPRQHRERERAGRPLTHGPSSPGVGPPDRRPSAATTRRRP
jgi:hypothetical protein